MRFVPAIVVVGLLAAISCLSVAYAADGAVFHAHWLRDIFIAPPLFIIEHGLPVDGYSPSQNALTFVLVFVAFWWIIWILVLLGMRKATLRNA